MVSDPKSGKFNPCPICGKERIVAKTWIEEIKTYGGTSKVTHTIMVCPDPECQKKTDMKIRLDREHAQAHAKAREEREKARRRGQVKP
ncbi:MAG: hypothetical protein ACOX6V_02090 [Patescibacteria group bacterium]|jgi:hypothetical protein